MAPITDSTLSPRQSATSGCPSTLSGGAIAGIVIGTIAGTLLIQWLFRLCQLPGAWGGGEPDPGYRPPVTRTSSRRRRRRPSYVEYVEKSPSGSRRHRDDVRRPERVLLS